MISWIVASNNPEVLRLNLARTLRPARDDDELIVEWDAPSIAAAYASGQAKATRPVRCYVHHDVQIIDLARLRELLHGCTLGVGMVGVVGSASPVVPWWDDTTKYGSVIDGRLGLLNFGPGGPAAYLDGLLLATRQDVDWDESIPGWHMYDHDACQQMLARGLTNYCLAHGHELLWHNTTGPTQLGRVNGWDEAVKAFNAKWGDR